MKKIFAALFLFGALALIAGCSTSSSTDWPAKDSLIISRKNGTVSSTGTYLRIEGSVKNLAKKPIRSAILRYEGINKSGAVLDSSQVPIVGPINPNEEKAFNTMVKIVPGMSNYSIYVNEASY